MPRVSIIMGVFNGEYRLDKAVNSIMDQSFVDWEFIICDDGSTDKSYEKLLIYSQRDNRIVVIRNDANIGLAQTLNNCLNKSQGEYIARMDDDDFAHKDRLLKQVEFLDKNPEYGIVATGRNFVDHQGVWGKDTYSGERTSLDIFKGNYFAHPTVMIRKSVYDSVQGYSTDPSIGRMEDVDLWCKMYSEKIKGFVIKDILLDYFESRNSMIRRKYRHRITEFKLKMKYRESLQIPLYYSIFAYKTLLVGLLPNSLIKFIHSIRFN